MSDLVGRSKWELDTPMLMVDLDAMEHNIAKMAAVFQKAHVNWRPHTKGIKIPAIAQRLLRAGAIGVTCAKLGEAEVMAASGITDVLVANEVVGNQKIARLVNLRRHADVMVCVDNVDNAEALNAAASEKGVTVRVLVEVNTGMNRCGVEPGAPAVRFSQTVAALPHLKFAGVMGWEGHVAAKAPSDEKRIACEDAVGKLVETARLCRGADLPVDIVSCGGTGTYQYTSAIPGVTEIQAGGGIFSDVTYDRWGIGHEYALTVLATIISRPTPTRVVFDAGRKTMSVEVSLPRPKALGEIGSVRLSAEHGTLELQEPRSDLHVGDKVEFIVGYGDTTVCLHDEMIGLRDDKVEVVWPILGRGKLR